MAETEHISHELGQLVSVTADNVTIRWRGGDRDNEEERIPFESLPLELQQLQLGQHVVVSVIREKFSGKTMSILSGQRTESPDLTPEQRQAFWESLPCVDEKTDSSMPSPQLREEWRNAIRALEESDSDL